MVRQSKLLLPLSLAFLLAAAAGVPRAEAAVTVGFGVFFDALAPHGTWTAHDRLGLVWSPDVAVGWRPYSDGHWAFAADEGWTWLGNETWAWAPYHYGNWFHDPVLGWLWVPGYEWQPAAVEWVVADDWIGWAPRPPRASWIAGPRILPAHYSFVERRFFVEPLLPRYVLPVTRNVGFLSVARPVRVLDVGWIERVVVRPIPRLRIRDVGTPRAVRAGWSKGEVRLFRPKIDRRFGLGPPAGKRIAKLERSAPRQGRELRPAARARDRDRVVVEPRGRGRGAQRLSGRGLERRVKVERSAPRSFREHRATRQARGGGGGRKFDRGGGGSGGRFDRAPQQRQRQHGAQRGGGRGGGKGGGKKGGG